MSIDLAESAWRRVRGYLTALSRVHLAPASLKRREESKVCRSKKAMRPAGLRQQHSWVCSCFAAGFFLLGRESVRLTVDRYAVLRLLLLGSDSALAP